MKIDYLNAKILSHRANLKRYRALLATQLTELEREYLHKRIAMERAELTLLEMRWVAKATQWKWSESTIVSNTLSRHASPPVRPDS